MIVNKNLDTALMTQESQSNVVNVDVKMLRTDWINKNGSLYYLFVLLSTAKEELFKTDLFKSLINGFWDDFSSQIRLWCFYPFLILFVLNNYYICFFMYTEKGSMDEKYAN